jgi:cytidine deaminase
VSRSEARRKAKPKLKEGFMIDYFEMAGKIAIPTNEYDSLRNFWLGAVGIRRDGVVVCAKNGAVHSTNVDNYQPIRWAHAETRVLRKLGKNGILYVARVSRKTGKFAMSRPCPNCQQLIRAYSAKKVYYSINESQYGIWDPMSDTDKVCNFKRKYGDFT